jgi:hypothetical protein
MDPEQFEEYIKTIKKGLKEKDLVKKLKKNIKKQKIQTAKTELFQITFIKDQIKLYQIKSHNHGRDSKKYIHNCVLQTLNVLGLRSYVLALQDSKRMITMYKDLYDRGIYEYNISDYLSTIFDTFVTDRPYQGPLDLKEGHATILSVGYSKKNDTRKWGTVLIIYKHKGIIRYYDTTTNTDTTSMKKIMKKCKTTQFEGYTYFYTDSEGAKLNKNKMVAPIQY